MSYRIIEKKKRKKYSDFNSSIEIKVSLIFLMFQFVVARQLITFVRNILLSDYRTKARGYCTVLYLDQTKYLKYVDKWKISGRAGELVAS